jgi:hypothetical protein
MIDRLEAFLQGGGSVLNLSGNVVWWKVTLRGDQLECRKDRGVHTQTGERGGKWKDLGRPSGPILGVRSDPRGIHTFAPFRVLRPDHWLFRGAGLEEGDRIGVDGLNEGGASGGEEDKVDAQTPATAVHLAHGLNPGNGGADIVFFETPQGGGVLSAGSISFCGSLVVDPALQTLVLNFLKAYSWPGGRRGRSAQCMPPSPASCLASSPTTALASPKSMKVLSRKYSSLSIPAKPGFLERLMA